MEFEKVLRDRRQWSIGDNCPVAKTLDLLSTKTAFLVVRECFYGTARFDEFMERLETSAPAVSRALKQLEAAGVVTRVPYQEPGKRAQDEYHLTPAGEELLPVFVALMQWGGKHLQNGRAPLQLVAKESGRPITARLTDDPDGASVGSGDIEVRLNPARPRNR